MSNLLGTAVETWTPNTRFPVARGVRVTNIAFAATGRMFGFWVPAEVFRKGTTIVVEVQGEATGLQLDVYVGGDASQEGHGRGMSFSNSDFTFFPNVARVQAIQVLEGPNATFQTGGTYNADGGTVDAAITVTTANYTNVFIQPLNFVSLRMGGTAMTITYASLEIIPGPSASGLRYQELLDV